MLSIKEIEEAIALQEKQRDQAIAQANYSAGYIASLKEIKQILSGTDEQPDFSNDDSVVKDLKYGTKKTRVH